MVIGVAIVIGIGFAIDKGIGVGNNRQEINRREIIRQKWDSIVWDSFGGKPKAGK
jgi:hypothetical protein